MGQRTWPPARIERSAVAYAMRHVSHLHSNYSFYFNDLETIRETSPVFGWPERGMPSPTFSSD